MCTIDKDFKRELMRRLQEKGTWTEALLFKERLRTTGESNETAWRRTAERYPTDDDYDMLDGCSWDASPEDKREVLALVKEFDESAGEYCMYTCIEWVDKHKHDDVAVKDLPSPAVWSWRKFIQILEAHFEDMVFQTKFEQSEEPDGGGGWREVDRRVKKAMRKMLVCLIEENSR